MPGVRQEQIDDLMEQASEALSRTAYIDAELLADRALHLAHRARAYDLMARICLPLQEARRQRFMQAVDASGGKVRMVDQPFDDRSPEEPGLYLVQPMLVAADARRLRTQALERRIPAVVLCREPLTSVGLQPVVAIGDLVVRTKVRPPKSVKQPSVTWFMEALEQLGDAAIEEIDAALTPVRRVEALLERLDAVVDHEKLHQRLADACRDAV